MKIRGGVAVVALLCVSLGGCHWDFWRSHREAPTGQVVATVGAHEITTRDLQSELANVTTTDPKLQKAARDQALQIIVKRTILADAAVAQGVDKDPDFAIRRERADQLSLIEAMEIKIAHNLPPPTRDDAEQYIADHSDLFGQRKIFTVDQIRFHRPNDPSFPEKLKPINTMDGIVALLNANGIAFMRGTGVIDAATQDPRLISAIVKLPPNDVFVIGSGGDLMVNQIVSSKIVPISGEPALNYALAVLKKQRTQDTVNRTMRDLLAKGSKDVRFNKDYAPTEKPAPAPAH